MKNLTYLEIKKQLPFLIPEQYNDAMSYQELLYAVISLVNEMVENINEIPDTIEADVTTEIQKLIDDGTIKGLINEQIFADLNTKINDNYTTLDEKITTNYNTLSAADAATNTKVDNNNSAVNLKIDNIAGDYVTPEQYGAAGNGEADDTAAINAAIFAAKIASKILLISGKYKITEQLADIDNLTIVGKNAVITSAYSGSGDLIKFKSCNVSGIKIVSNTNHTGAILAGNDFNNAKFSDITLYYGGTGIKLYNTASSFAAHITGFNISDCSQKGIHINNLADTFISDGIINNCGVGIVFENGSDGLYVTNVDIISCDYAFRGYCYGANMGSTFFSNVLFDSSKTDNFSIDGTVGSNVANALQISNCWFSNPGNRQAYFSLVRNGEISNCIFQYSKGLGVNVTKCNNLKFNNCTFYANSKKDQAHMALYDNVGTIINGCTIGGYGTGAFDGYGANRSIFMSGNTYSIITNNRSYDCTATDITGVESGAVVKNNIGITDR